MPTVQRDPEEVASSLLLDQPTDAAVRETLESVLLSQPFRTSKQCQNLLSYIVEHSLHDDDSSLKERVLGIEVFGRSPNYDTSEDPVVRMRAADVRKRLAQFYQSNSHDLQLVHIHLKPGSYRATFSCDHDTKPEGSTEMLQELSPEAKATIHSEVNDDVVAGRSALVLQRTPGKLFKIITISLLSAVTICVGAWRIWLVYSLTPQKRFWAPLIRPNQSVLIYVGANAVYRFTPQFMTRYQKEHGIKQEGPEFMVDLPKGGTIQADDLEPVKDCFVSVADLAAATQVVSLVHGWNKPINLRTAADMTISDIRNVPSILIGGFNNSWALKATSDLPFAFRDGVRIENKKDPSHSWRVDRGRDVAATEDYALVSRLLTSNTGGPVLTIGGIGSFGTQAAAEFVTNPEKLKELLKSAPAGWESKNMQAVLRIKVEDNAPISIEVVATSYW